MPWSEVSNLFGISTMLTGISRSPLEHDRQPLTLQRDLVLGPGIGVEGYVYLPPDHPYAVPVGEELSLALPAAHTEEGYGYLPSTRQAIGLFLAFDHPERPFGVGEVGLAPFGDIEHDAGVGGLLVLDHPIGAGHVWSWIVGADAGEGVPTVNVVHGYGQGRDPELDADKPQAFERSDVGNGVIPPLRDDLRVDSRLLDEHPLVVLREGVRSSLLDFQRVQHLTFFSLSRLPTLRGSGPFTTAY